MYQTQTEVVPRLESLLDYTFTNRELGWESLQCKAAGGYAEGNKRLALIGDAYIKLHLLSVWYPSGNSTQTGNDAASRAANNGRLAKLGYQIQLQDMINPSMAAKGHVSDRQIADTVEAIVGAVFIDGGEKSIGRVMEKLGLL